MAAKTLHIHAESIEEWAQRCVALQEKRSIDSDYTQEEWEQAIMVALEEWYNHLDADFEQHVFGRNRTLIVMPRKS